MGFFGNVADEGGALSLCPSYDDSAAGAATFVATNATFSGNGAVHGGAAFLDDGTSLMLNGSVVDGNVALYSGGAFYLTDAALSLRETSAARNGRGVEGGFAYVEAFGAIDGGGTTSVAASAADAGAGVYAFDFSTVSVAGVGFSDGAALHGGVLYCAVGATCALSRVVSRRNEALLCGALAYADRSAALSLAGVRSVGDVVPDGVVYAVSGATVDVADSAFERSAVGCCVLSLNAADRLDVANATWNGTVAATAGAVLKATGVAAATVVDSEIVDVAAGAAAALVWSSAAAFRATRFAGGSGTMVLDVLDSAVDLYNATFARNTGGPAVGVSDGAVASFTGSRFLNNQSRLAVHRAAVEYVHVRDAIRDFPEGAQKQAQLCLFNLGQECVTAHRAVDPECKHLASAPASPAARAPTRSAAQVPLRRVRAAGLVLRVRRVPAAHLPHGLHGFVRRRLHRQALPRGDAEPHVHRRLRVPPAVRLCGVAARRAADGRAPHRAGTSTARRTVFRRPCPR